MTDEQIDTLLSIERLFEQAVEYAKADYAQQSQHFKNLVKFENRLLFVYFSFLHIKSDDSKEILTKQSAKIWHTLQPGGFSKGYFCQLCSVFKGDIGQYSLHMGKCRYHSVETTLRSKTLKKEKIKRASFQLKQSKGAFCHFGCDYKAKTVSIRHHLKHHSSEELQAWGIQVEILKFILAGKVSMPIEFILKKLDRGQSDA